MTRGTAALATTLLTAALVSGCASVSGEETRPPGGGTSSGVASPSVEVSPPVGGSQEPDALASPDPGSSPGGSLAPSDTGRSAIAAPLLVLSGSVADEAGDALQVRLELTGIDPVTEQDLADIDEVWCGDAPDKGLDRAEARMVTFDVEVTASDGFTGWTDDRGVLVEGDLFEGPMWEQSANVDGCVPTTRVVRPGTGTARVAVSSEVWDVPGPVDGDDAVTLSFYGMTAQGTGSLGQPTGTAVVDDCEIESAPELDALALEVAPALAWGNASIAPQYCLYGRMPNDW